MTDPIAGDERLAKCFHLSCPLKIAQESSCAPPNICWCLVFFKRDQSLQVKVSVCQRWHPAVFQVCALPRNKHMSLDTDIHLYTSGCQSPSFCFRRILTVLNGYSVTFIFLVFYCFAVLNKMTFGSVQHQQLSSCNCLTKQQLNTHRHMIMSRHGIGPCF